MTLSEVVSALSFALDLTEGAVPGHSLRSCLLGMRIGAVLGLGTDELNDLYYALLLKDIGCSSNSARMYQILGSDERRAKSAIKIVDWTDSSWAAAQWSWTYAVPGASLRHRVKWLAGMKRDGERNNVDMFRARCDRGGAIVRKVGLSERCARGVQGLDEHWNGEGYPDKVRGDAIPMLSRILLISQHLDVFAGSYGRERAITTMVQRSGSWFDPEVVRVAAALHRDQMLWTGCNTPDERVRVMAMEPNLPEAMNTGQIDRVCAAFAEVVDAKSPFTYRHSVGVMEAANAISGQLGLPPERRQLIHRAALLHDLGKLSISNAILDKAGGLSESEWTVVREHPLHSEKILARISSFDAIATVSGRHHERLDGSGYPRHLGANDLSLEDRIVAMADVYATLSEDRPYQPRMKYEEIRAILLRHIEQKLDPMCFEALGAFMESRQNVLELVDSNGS